MARIFLNTEKIKALVDDQRLAEDNLTENHQLIKETLWRSHKIHQIIW